MKLQKNNKRFSKRSTNSRLLRRSRRSRFSTRRVVRSRPTPNSKVASSNSWTNTSLRCKICTQPASMQEYDNRLKYCVNDHPDYVCESCLRRLASKKNAKCPFCRNPLIVKFLDVSSRSSTSSRGSLFRGISLSEPDLFNSPNNDPELIRLLPQEQRTTITYNEVTDLRDGHNEPSIIFLSRTNSIAQHFIEAGSDLVKNKNCPNFRILYYRDVFSRVFFTENIGGRTLMEYFLNYTSPAFDFPIFENILLQLALALYTAQKISHMVFDILDPSVNIFMCAIPLTNYRSHLYIAGDEEDVFNVPNIGLIPIIDQSNANCLPYFSYNDDYYKTTDSIKGWRMLLDKLKEIIINYDGDNRSLEYLMNYEEPSSMQELIEMMFNY